MKCVRTVHVLLFAVVLPITDAFAQSWSCENNNLKRYVDIHYPSSPSHAPCSVIYRKPTEGRNDRILWQARNNEGYCKKKAEAFVKTLTSWGWRCSANASISGRKSKNSKPTDSTSGAVALEKRLYDAIKLDEVDKAKSVRFDQYLDLLEDYKIDYYIDGEPNGYINDHHAYYLLNKQTQLLGHKIIVLTQPAKTDGQEDCCADRKFMIYLETVGTTDPLKAFTESNDCYFKDKYIWPFDGMHFSAGQYAVMEC